MGTTLAGFIAVLATAGMMAGAALLDVMHQPRPAPVVSLMREVELQRVAVLNLRSYAEATRRLCGVNARGTYQIPGELDHRYWVVRHNRAVAAYQRAVIRWAVGSENVGVENTLPAAIVPCEPF